MKGSTIISWVKGNKHGNKLYQAFYNKHGKVVADTAAISLYYENGTFKYNSVGVCSPKYMIGGDYRNCNYADLNSAGFDMGLKQINTFWQSGAEKYKGLQSRIAKLGGPTCKFNNKAESKNRDHPCNQEMEAWLTNVDNNIKISLDIYEDDNNFYAWYGYKRAFNK